MDDDNAEGQTGQGVQGIVALKEAREKRAAVIAAAGRHRRQRVGRFYQGRHQHDAQENQKRRVQEFSHRVQNLGGFQREIQHRRKKQPGENQLRQNDLFPHQGADADGEAGGRTAGNGKQRPDGEIERAGKKITEGLGNPPGEINQALAAGDADGDNAQQRNAYGCNQQANQGRRESRSGSGSQNHGENQVAGSEKQAEQHRANQRQLAGIQFLIHVQSSCMTVILTRYLSIVA